MTANTLDIVRSYIDRGWSPIPVPHRSKNPGFDDWPDLRITRSTVTDHFNGRRQNIGGLTGAPSGNLVDVDLDSIEAVRLAPRSLDPTRAVFGRQSKRESHRLYIADPLTATEKLKDPTDGKSIVELRSTGARTILPGSTHPSGEPVEWDMDGEPTLISGPALVGQVKHLAAAALLAKHWPGEGSRHDASLALSGGLLRAGWETETVEAFIDSVAWAAGDDEVEDRVDTVSYTAERIAAGKPATGWPSLAKIIGERVVDAVLDWLDIGAQDTPSFAAGATGSTPAAATPSSYVYPSPLDPAAFHGLAGEIVGTITPETEADPAAILLTLLTAVGNIVGSGPHWRAGGSVHALRLFSVFVGPTSKGRKGTSWSAVDSVLRHADPDWAAKQPASGLSSGEGLIWEVRDEIRKSEPIKQQGRIIDHQEVVTDPGVSDKRLLVVEEEYSGTIKIMAREGNSLSSVIRRAWDTGDLRTMTKNAPARATGAHISIIGHTTQDELLRYLTNTEAGNGFGNRFIWICVRRSKALPEGGNLHYDTIAYLGGQLRQVVETSRSIGLIERDDAARELWHIVYGPLSEGGAGLLGAMTSRAEAQVMRLASIYAVLDETNRISPDHLRAALALWDYSEASCRYIFGDRMGDPDADAILDALRRSGGMSQTDISNLFGRNLPAARIERALSVLYSAGKVTFSTEKGKGRPATTWRAG